MEPEAQTNPTLSPEQAANLPAGESSPRSEQVDPAANTAPTAEPVVAPLPPIPSQPITSMPSVAPLVVVPSQPDLEANDVDVIEKPWVERTEAVLSRDKEDPHQEEDDVTDVERDYQKQRFGRDVPKPTDQP